jgi:hypothetical protein
MLPCRSFPQASSSREQHKNQENDCRQLKNITPLLSSKISELQTAAPSSAGSCDLKLPVAASKPTVEHSRDPSRHTPTDKFQTKQW